MLSRQQVFILASLLSGAFASPTFSNLVVHESISDAPDGFSKVGSARAGQMLNLRIALVNSDIAGLEDKLFAVSTPSSALYGQHLTKEEVKFYNNPSYIMLIYMNEG